MINIDRVYRTVLNIINKENNGYVTPEEFNTLAAQAQTEIFEKYFYDQNRASATNRMSSGDYSDLMRNLEEKITFFDQTANIPALERGGANGFVTYPNNFYRLGVISVEGNFADEVSHKDILYIEQAPLTKSTTKSPKYTRHEDGVFIFPRTIPEVTMVYVRQPATPIWAGGLMSGQNVPVLNGATDATGRTRQDFELHPSEEPELVSKILAFAGVLIRDPEAAGAGAQSAQIIKQDEV